MARIRPVSANIGPKGVRLRRRAGMLAGVLSAGALMLLVALDAPPLARLLLLPLLFASALGLLQAREQTWVTLASRGSRDMDGRIERIDDSSERDRVRANARRVVTQALIMAAILTIATLFLR